MHPLKIAVLCPHFAPDTAPTGDVITRIVHELVDLGHEVHVVTALPWYRHHRIEDGWTGRPLRRETTDWGSITRVNPFPGKDKGNLLRRALGFIGFSGLAGLAGLFGGPVGRADIVLAMSPPLTMGLTGWLVHLGRRGPLVFNIQDVFPDAAVQTGAITNTRVIAVAKLVEKISYEVAGAVTVLSDDLRDNVAAKMRRSRRSDVHVIPNFVDTEFITPGERMTPLRAEHGIGDEPVVLYAGNVGFSQSLDLVLEAARRTPQATFLINGGGAARISLQAEAAGLANVRFGDYLPKDRLPELLATGDLHVVPLKAGLGAVSVPSKTYSILAAGRPVLASIDAGTEVPRMLDASGAGVVVPPDDADAFVTALHELLADPDALAARGAAGREWVLSAASPRAVGLAYEKLFRDLIARRRR